MCQLKNQAKAPTSSNLTAILQNLFTWEMCKCPRDPRSPRGLRALGAAGEEAGDARGRRPDAAPPRPPAPQRPDVHLEARLRGTEPEAAPIPVRSARAGRDQGDVTRNHRGPGSSPLCPRVPCFPGYLPNSEPPSPASFKSVFIVVTVRMEKELRTHQAREASLLGNKPLPAQLSPPPAGSFHFLTAKSPRGAPLPPATLRPRTPPRAALLPAPAR